MYQIGINALQAADDYIAGRLTGEEAYIKVKEYNKQADAQKDKDCANLGVKSLFNTELHNDSAIATDISFLYHEIDNVKNGNSAMSDVRERRDNLAEQLGKKRNENKKSEKALKGESKYSYEELKKIQNYINEELLDYGFKYSVFANEREKKIDIYISLDTSYHGAEEIFASTVEWDVPIIKQAQRKYKFEVYEVNISFLLYDGSLENDVDATITYDTNDLVIGTLISTKNNITKSSLPYEEIREILC